MFLLFGSKCSLEADIVFNSVYASINTDCVLLKNYLLLDQSVHLLFEKVALVAIVDLDLVEILLQVCDVLNNLLQDIVCSLNSMVF